MALKKTQFDFLLRFSLTLMFVLGVVLGLSKIVYSIMHLPARADEYISLLQSGHTDMMKSMKLIKEGMDNSYLHTLLSGIAFRVFPDSLQTLRFISFFFWCCGLLCLFRTLRVSGSDFVVSCVFTSLAGFSILGDFLARDGRFYSLLFFISTWWFLIVLNLLRREKTGILDWLKITSATILGFLASLNFILLAAVAVPALVINYSINKSDPNLKRKTILSLTSIVTGFTIYFLFAWIDFFPSYFANGFSMTLPRGSISPTDLPIWNIFRWISIPAIPFLGPEAEIAVLAITMAATTAIHLKTGETRPQTTSSILIVSAGIISIAIPLVHTLVILINPLKPWYFRYYTPFFFTSACLWAVFMGNPFEGKIKTMVFTYLIAGFFIFQALESTRIEETDKQSRTLSEIAEKLDSSGIMQGNRPLVFKVNALDGYAEKRLFAALYCRYPDYREKMSILMPDEWRNDSIRSHSINILKREFKEFRYFYESEYQKETENKKLDLVITHRENLGPEKFTDLHWEDLVLIHNPGK